MPTSTTIWTDYDFLPGAWRSERWATRLGKIARRSHPERGDDVLAWWNSTRTGDVLACQAFDTVDEAEAWMRDQGMVYAAG